MPSSIEVPTSPPGRSPEPFSKRKRARYEELEPDELLHLIDRLEDERSRALRREGIWISFIAHLILFWFLFYGPRAHRVHVVNPDANKQKDMTFLNLPPDAQRPVKPPKQAPPSDKDRMAQSRHPTLDKKTLQQLEAMRKAGPPIPTARSAAGASAIAGPRAPAAGTGSSSDSTAARRQPTSRCSMNPSRSPRRPSRALTPASRLPGTPFARPNETPLEVPPGSRVITDRMRPPSIRQWQWGLISSATRWGSILALI